MSDRKMTGDGMRQMVGGQAEKVLSISIAAYNVASTLDECISSCLEARHADLLDIMVVDDGSTDETASIAQSYAEARPGTIRVVSKPNGGYGSTVNTSVPLARGRYFRLLDGDDWVDPAGLDLLLELLGSSQVDLAIAPFVECVGDARSVVDLVAASVDGEVSFEGDLVQRNLNMHAICYRTEILRTSGLQLPERCLYTDTLYNVVPLQLVRTALVTHVPVYQYRLGLDGQSVSRASLMAHRADMRLVVDELLSLYGGIGRRDSLPARMALAWIATDVGWLCRILLGMGASDEARAELESLLEAARRDPKVRAACRARSKVFHALDRMPAGLYGLAVRGYDLVRKVTGG